MSLAKLKELTPNKVKCLISSYRQFFSLPMAYKRLTLKERYGSKTDPGIERIIGEN